MPPRFHSSVECFYWGTVFSLAQKTSKALASSLQWGNSRPLIMCRPDGKSGSCLSLDLRQDESRRSNRPRVLSRPVGRPVQSLTAAQSAKTTVPSRAPAHFSVNGCSSHANTANPCSPSAAPIGCFCDHHVLLMKQLRRPSLGRCCVDQKEFAQNSVSCGPLGSFTRGPRGIAAASPRPA